MDNTYTIGEIEKNSKEKLHLDGKINESVYVTIIENCIH